MPASASAAANELGVLFERGKQKIRPTPLGDKIVAMAAKVLERAAAIKDVAEADKDQIEGPISRGTLPIIGPHLLLQFTPKAFELALQTCHRRN